jgi:phosphoribosyl 1,2-cyclic phosphodiesterase
VHYTMSLFICSLNSGSNGNCYYVGNHNEAVLIDAGLSCKETEKRFDRLNLDIKKVKAIFISHEHIDHISGLEAIARKYQLPVYINQKTLANSGLKLEASLINDFDTNAEIKVGKLSVVAFSKFHDAADAHSFVVKSGTLTIGVFTDIGSVCKQLMHHFKQCNAAFLEANYDEEMLQNGAYPAYLKKRISGKYGHLSNRQALELMQKHKPPFMTHLFLAHLSKENNHPDLVTQLFKQHASHTKIEIASRTKETALFQILPSARNGVKISMNPSKMNQLSLFENF